MVRAFNQAGVLDVSDVHVAQRLCALAGESDERVALAVAVAVRALRAGSVCVDLLSIARAHITGGSRDPRLLELQLVDPSLGWQWLDPDIRNLAQRDFALCVQSALERLGLGPFSHRRP